ncbi:MAG: hypothetical protein ACOYK8_07505, partial [Alphaproteobacteria bacterium]
TPTATPTTTPATPAATPAASDACKKSFEDAIKAARAQVATQTVGRATCLILKACGDAASTSFPDSSTIAVAGDVKIGATVGIGTPSTPSTPAAPGSLQGSLNDGIYNATFTGQTVPLPNFSTSSGVFSATAAVGAAATPTPPSGTANNVLQKTSDRLQGCLSGIVNISIPSISILFNPQVMLDGLMKALEGFICAKAEEMVNQVVAQANQAVSSLTSVPQQMLASIPGASSLVTIKSGMNAGKVEGANSVTVNVTPPATVPMVPNPL